MEDTPPGHEMPHAYPGPELSFRHTFPESGRYATWTQFARASAPDVAITAHFQLVVDD